MQTTLNFDDRTAQIQAVHSAAVAREFDTDGATAFVLNYLKAGPAFSQDVTEAACLAGFEPHDKRAFGQIFVSLAKAGLIERAGYAVRRNKSPGLVWRLASSVGIGQ